MAFFFKWNISKLKIILIIISLIIMTSYFWIYDIYINIKYEAISVPVIIFINGINNYDGAVVLREAPESGLYNFSKNKNIFTAEKCYIKNIYIGLKDEAINEIKTIDIKIGNERYNFKISDILNLKSNIKNKFPDNDNKFIFYKFSINQFQNKSKIEFFKDIINWPGDLKLILKSFSILTLLKILLLFVPSSFFICIFKIDFNKTNKSKLLYCVIINLVLLILFIFLKFNKVILYYSFIASVIITFLILFNYKIPFIRFDLKDIRKYIFLVLIIIFAFSIRVYKLDHGFPFSEIDEDNITDVQVLMNKNHTLYPYNFQRPNNISIYINSAVFDIVSYIKFNKSLSDTFYDNRTFFYYIARFFVALIGSLSVLLIYLIGKEFDRKTGFLLSIIFAVFPIFVAFCHKVNPDIIITFFILCTIYTSIKFLKKKNIFYLILSCIFAAFATAEKYPGFLSMLMVIYCIIITSKNANKMIYNFTLTFSVYFLSIFIISPFLLLDNWTIIYALTKEATAKNPGAYGWGYFGNVLFYLKTLIDNVGLLSLLVMIIGIFGLIINKYIKYLFLLLFCFVYILIISALSLHWTRWAMPMFISPILLTGFGLSFLMTLINSFNSKIKILLYPFYFFMTLIIFSNMIIKDIEESVILSITDTRNLAYDFIKKNNIDFKNSLNPMLDYTVHDTKNFFMKYNEIEYMKDKKYIVLSSDIYIKYFIYKDIFLDEYNLFNEIFKLKLIYKITPSDLPYYFKSYIEFINISNIKNFIIFYNNNFINLLNGPEIRIYKTNSN